MRFLLPLLLLASCGVLHAQVQERKLVDRLLQPDLTLGNSMQGKTFSAEGSGVDASRSANVKDFYFVQKFSAKSFDTRQYDSKDFWQGDFQFATKAAPIKEDSAANKTFATKTVPVKDAREAGKSYNTSGYATRDADVHGKTSQSHLDELYSKGKPPMTIDEVRDLLNKPKL